MKTLQTGEKLYEALKILVELTKFAQNNFPNQTYLSSKQWAKEFCTINLRVPRRSGHDYCIAQFLKDNPDLCPVIFAPVRSIEEILKQELKEHKVNNTLYSGSNINALRGIKNINCAICTCASMMSKTKIEKIYDLSLVYIPVNPNFLFLMIG